MNRNANDKWLGGVLGGMARSFGISSGLLRAIFIVLSLGIGGLTFGISLGAVILIYLIFWMTLSKQ
ncbi:MAG: PspC domain-containing protein [Cytophagales bacterium]|nr:PspC domain-containing protein [Cytophagales bacterium]